MNQSGIEGKIFIKYMVSSFLLRGIKKFPNCAYLTLYYSHFEMSKLYLIAKSYFIFKSIKQNQLNVFDLF